MQNRTRSRRVAAVLGALAFIIALPFGAFAEEPANDYFERTWERTDRPVANDVVDRTWIWGPSGFTADCMEPYFKTNAGEREVQYFDKSRMEITDPSADSNSEWYVTQGLLATEMITGQMQIGDHQHVDWGPADVHIAGDQGGGAPNYAHFAPLMDSPALGAGESIIQTLSGDGTQGQDPALGSYGVTAQEYVPETEHRVASVFWDFMNSQGPIIENGVSTTGPIFSNPFYAVGFPTTEAYWTNVAVGGVTQDVLVQAFERRVLTYTPGNDEGWQVEAGNVGQHYYMWRYGQIPGDSSDACADTLHVTFNVYQPAGNDEWDRIAVTTTREVWHPGDIATGTWMTYTDDGSEILPINSSGYMVAEHNYTTTGGQRMLSGLSAEINEVDGPTGGTAQINAGNFSPGNDSRVPSSFFKGSGTLDYQTVDGSGSIGFEVLGSSASTFHIFLDGPAPPILFR